MALSSGLSNLRDDINKSKVAVMLAMILSKETLISEIYFLFGPELFLRFLFAFQGQKLEIPRLKDITSTLRKIIIFINLHGLSKSEMRSRAKDLGEKFRLPHDYILSIYKSVEDEYQYMLNLIDKGDVV